MSSEEAMRIEVSGLRDLLGRFAHDADEGLRERQDRMLRSIATQTKERLSAAAPRSAGPKGGPHLADMFALADLQREGASASIAVTNTKTTRTKAGNSYSLLRLVSGGTLPHDIPDAFGYGPTFGIGGRFAGKFHPGTQANPFVARTVAQLDPQAALMTTARGVIADLAGVGGPS